MDVLVVGAGPVGYMAAVTLARYDIDFCIIDKRALPVLTSHASGLQPRTQEIFITMSILNQLTAKTSKCAKLLSGGLMEMGGSTSRMVSTRMPSQGLRERVWESR